MKLNINRIGFEIEPVPETLRPSLFSDDVLRRGTWRDVYDWDAKAGEGRVSARTVGQDGVALGNALTFFLPRATPEGTIVNNEGPARKMRERFLEAAGARDLDTLLRVLSRVVPLPRVPVPLGVFRPLNAVASYRLRMFTDFSVVRLREPGRNLAAYLFVPGQVAFHHEITEVIDPAGHDAALKARMAEVKPHFILPAGSQAAHGIRLMAIANRIEKLRPAIEAGRENGGTPPEALAMDFARLVREWKALSQPRTRQPLPPGARARA